MRSELYFVRCLLALALSWIAGLYLLLVPGDALWSLMEVAWLAFSAANIVGYVVSEVRKARRR